MAAIVQVAGPVDVQVKLFGGSLESLGYSANGVTATTEAFFLNVPGDENGGDDGPPIDVQYLGEIARIRVELTKYDDAVANKIRARIVGGTAGTPGTPGTLMFDASNSIRLLLQGTSDPRNFPRVIVRGAIEVNRGTKYSRFICEFEAHKDATGVLYNASVAA